MMTAPPDTPRSKRRPDLPIVFPLGQMVYFPDGGDDYLIPYEELQKDFSRWLYPLEEESWWTHAHELTLRRILFRGRGEDE